MRRLLCRLGIHSPTWQAVRRIHPLAENTIEWLQIRRCTRCARTIGRARR